MIFMFFYNQIFVILLFPSVKIHLFAIAVTLSSGSGLRGFLETYFATSSARSAFRGAPGFSGGVAICLATMLTQLITGS